MKTTELQNLPQSKLTYNQKKTYGPVFFTEHGRQMRIIAKVRYDDECKNGHNTFSITAEIDEKGDSGRWRESSGGCCHDAVAKHFPQLAPLIKWHLTSSDGPMHYLENTIYLAGERDCHGLLKDEFRQHTSLGPHENGGVEGVPNWVLELPDISTDVYAMEKPKPVTIEWKAYGCTGKGKARELDAARNSAVWPEATDDELTAPGLKERLIARLPQLMAEFKAAIESLGFEY